MTISTEGNFDVAFLAASAGIVTITELKAFIDYLVNDCSAVGTTTLNVTNNAGKLALKVQLPVANYPTTPVNDVA